MCVASPRSSPRISCAASRTAPCRQTGFLRQTARASGLTDLEAHDVKIRISGNFAIIHARTSFRLTNGKAGSGRYTDIWERRNGHWLAVAAHVTRLA